MKTCTRILIVVLAFAASLVVSHTSYAAPPSNPSAASLTDQNRLASVHSGALSVRAMTRAQYVAQRAAAGHPLSAAEAKALAGSACTSGGASSWGENAFGGVLFKLTLDISWCYDGSSVWGGSYTWNWSTGYGWSFNKWTNPPNDWYVPGYAEYHAAAQARFCTAWCAEDHYTGLEDIGNRDGGFSWHDV